MQDMKGKTAVVTGAASGIGRALTARFVAEGASVVMGDIGEAALNDVAKQLQAASANVLPVVTDVTDVSSVEALADAAFERYGAVDILCTNTGIMGPKLAPAWETPLEDWQHVFAVNTFGMVHAIHSFLPRMIASGREGHIVLTASMAAVTGASITTAPYIASKHATRAIAETLRRNLAELDSPISVSVLCPGPTNTGMLAHVRRTFPSFDSAHAAVGGEFVLEPDQVADIVLDAIRTHRFFIFTHPDSRRRVTDWFDTILRDLPA